MHIPLPFNHEMETILIDSCLLYNVMIERNNWEVFLQEEEGGSGNLRLLKLYSQSCRTKSIRLGLAEGIQEGSDVRPASPAW